MKTPASPVHFDHLETTVSRAIGLLHLLAVTAARFAGICMAFKPLSGGGQRGKIGVLPIWARKAPLSHPVSRGLSLRPASPTRVLQQGSVVLQRGSLPGLQIPRSFLPGTSETLPTWQASPSDPLPPCPFCQRADLLEEIHWSNEREDGTEFDGPAIRCNRCDAIAPAAAWMKHKGGAA